MSEFEEKLYTEDAFNFDDRNASNDRDVSVERLNELLYSRSISPKEHSFLMRNLFPSEKGISVFSWVSLTCAVVSWVSFLSFDYGEKTFTLMSGANKFRVISVLAPLVLILSYLAYREIKTKHNVKGLEMALIAATLAAGQLTIAVPIWLMKIYLMM